MSVVMPEAMTDEEVDAYNATNRRMSLYIGPMFSVKNDVFDKEEDADGYISWYSSGDSMTWTAREWSDDEIDQYLGLDTYRSLR